MQYLAIEEAVESDDFESIYRRLEETVAQLESGGLSLDESIRLYETGMRLARRCKELLDAAELRVSELEEEFDAETISDFEERVEEDEDEE